MTPFAVLAVELLHQGYQEFQIVEFCCRNHGSWRARLEVTATVFIKEVECPRCHRLRPAGFMGRALARAGDVDPTPYDSNNWRAQHAREAHYHLGRPQLRLRKYEKWDGPLGWLQDDGDDTVAVACKDAAESRRKADRRNNRNDWGLTPDQLENRLKNRARIA